jgi:arylsulfatase A-like enzyme
MCARVDAQVGLLVRELKARGIYDETALFVFSDHGDYTGDYGIVEKAQNLFEDCLVRVPLILKPPAGRGVRPGVRDGMVELVDVSATAYDLAGIPPKHHHFGRSLCEYLAGDAPGRDAVFCEGGYRAGEPLESAATEPESLYWPRTSISAEDPQAYGRAIMVRTRTHKYVKRIGEPDELYDLVQDPMEMKNIVGEPRMAGVRAEMRNRLLEFLWETGDVVPARADARDSRPAPITKECP